MKTIKFSAIRDGSRLLFVYFGGAEVFGLDQFGTVSRGHVFITDKATAEIAGDWCRDQGVEPVKGW